MKRAHAESVDDFFLIVPYYLNKVVRTKLGGTVSSALRKCVMYCLEDETMEERNTDE